MEAIKPLRNGRLHIKVSTPHGKYIMNIHFDPANHFDILHPPRGRMMRDCKEIRDFVEKYVTPTIRKYRSV